MYHEKQSAVRYLRTIGKINKLGKRVPRNLNERQMKNRKVTRKILLQRHERKSFMYRIVTGDEKWIYFKNPKRKYRGFHLAKPVHKHQGQIASVRRQWSVSGGSVFKRYCVLLTLEARRNR